MKHYDVVIVGSGINSLVCAAELTVKGRRVLVLERENVAGGCIRTEEATVPGFRHDLFSMSYPQFVSAPFYPTLWPKLEAQGARMVSAEIPSGVLLPDGRFLLLRQARDENVAAFDAVFSGDGQSHAHAMANVEANANLIFGLLGGEPRSAGTYNLLAQTLSDRGVDGLAGFGADALLSARDWLERTFHSELMRALIAPWVLHAGLGPESGISAMMAQVMMFTLETVGIPFIVGGSSNLVTAFQRVIEAGGGAVMTDADVTEVTVEDGVATGVATSSGECFAATCGVVCNVTPTQLYQRLLPQALLPPTVYARAAAYRYGRACMQIHVAMSEPPQWGHPDLGKVGVLHLTAGLDGVSRAVNEATRGLLPAEPTIAVGQPAAADPSRCPPGTSQLWIQLLELPRVVHGDAAGLIKVSEGGRWTDAVAETYAERILARLRNHIPNLDAAALGLKVLGPHALESYNMNLVGGDPYSGDCSIDQFHILRSTDDLGYQTPIQRLYHIGASTHPGPGLNGVSGHHVALEIG